VSWTQAGSLWRVMSQNSDFACQIGRVEDSRFLRVALEVPVHGVDVSDLQPSGHPHETSNPVPETPGFAPRSSTSK